MKTRLAFTSVMLVASTMATSSAAQTAETTQQQAQPATLQQVQTQELQTVNPTLNQAILRQPLSERARPDRPRLMPVNWAQVQGDLRQQNALVTGELTTATRLVQRFPRPTNDDALRVTETRLPVLMPTLEALDLGGTPRVLLFPRENFYTLSVRGPRILIEVFGTRLAHTEAPDPASLRRLRARGPSGLDITRTEYGVEVNFSRYGAAYSVTVECDNPLSDPRCTGPDYARRIAETMVIAAGTPNEGELP